MSDSSLSDLSDDEGPHPVIRHVRERNDPFNTLSNEEFVLRFRFSKQSVMDLVHKIGHTIQPITHRSKSIDSLNQVIVTLRFYATGSFQQTIGDLLNIHKSTVGRIIHRVTHQICRLRNDFIKMPLGEELSSTIVGFYSIAGFPRVVGALDCTHIKIKSPGGNNAELFRNRKQFFSINVQVVCDSNLKILDIIARWPGSVHDSTIFNNSPLCAAMENNAYGNTFLLGDSGYPCKPYLLTPLLNPDTPSKEAYNRAQIATRNPIERCFGVLKRRFPCLHVGMAIKLNNVLKVIVACAILHNLALADPLPVDDIEMPFNEIIALGGDELNIGNRNDAVRTALINSVFAR